MVVCVIFHCRVSLSRETRNAEKCKIVPFDVTCVYVLYTSPPIQVNRPLVLIHTSASVPTPPPHPPPGCRPTVVIVIMMAGVIMLVWHVHSSSLLTFLSLLRQAVVYKKQNARVARARVACHIVVAKLDGTLHQAHILESMYHLSITVGRQKIRSSGEDLIPIGLYVRTRWRTTQFTCICTHMKTARPMGIGANMHMCTHVYVHMHMYAHEDCEANGDRAL